MRRGLKYFAATVETVDGMLCEASIDLMKPRTASYLMRTLQPMLVDGTTNDFDGKNYAVGKVTIVPITRLKELTEPSAQLVASVKNELKEVKKMSGNWTYFTATLEDSEGKSRETMFDFQKPRTASHLMRALQPILVKGTMYDINDKLFAIGKVTIKREYVDKPFCDTDYPINKSHVDYERLRKKD